MFSVAPSLPAWRVAAILRATARDLGAPGPDNEFGAGLIDAAAAVRAAVAEIAGAGTRGALIIESSRRRRPSSQLAVPSRESSVVSATVADLRVRRPED